MQAPACRHRRRETRRSGRERRFRLVRSRGLGHCPGFAQALSSRLQGRIDVSSTAGRPASVRGRGPVDIFGYRVPVRVVGGRSPAGRLSRGRARFLPVPRNNGLRIQCGHARAGRGRPVVPSSRIRARGRGVGLFSGVTASAGIAFPATRSRTRSSRPPFDTRFGHPTGLSAEVAENAAHRRPETLRALHNRVARPGRRPPSRDVTDLRRAGRNRPVRRGRTIPSASRRSVSTGGAHTGAFTRRVSAGAVSKPASPDLLRSQRDRPSARRREPAGQTANARHRRFRTAGHLLPNRRGRARLQDGARLRTKWKRLSRPDRRVSRRRCWHAVARSTLHRRGSVGFHS